MVLGQVTKSDLFLHLRNPDSWHRRSGTGVGLWIHAKVQLAQIETVMEPRTVFERNFPKTMKLIIHCYCGPCLVAIIQDLELKFQYEPILQCMRNRAGLASRDGNESGHMAFV